MRGLRLLRLGLPRPLGAPLLRRLLFVHCYVFYLFRGQWVDSRLQQWAPQGSQGVRGVRFENDYLFRGWRADTRRRQRGSSRRRGSICARTACISTVSATTMASCMEHKVALATGSAPPGQWAVGQSRDQEGLMAVKERKRVFGHVHLSGILGASAGLRGGRAAVFPLLLRILPYVSLFVCGAVVHLHRRENEAQPKPHSLGGGLVMLCFKQRRTNSPDWSTGTVRASWRHCTIIGVHWD